MSGQAMKTKYNQLREQEVYELFCGPSWDAMDEDSRLQALQELELRMAARQHREPYAVRLVPEDMDRPNLQGFFNEEAIYLNRRFMSAKGFLAKTYSAAQALDTLIHEGRHAFQASQIQDVENLKDREKMIWRCNYSAYIGAPRSKTQFCLYAFQPIERDARRFAAQELKRIYRHIVQATGHEDPKLREGIEVIRLIKQREYQLACQRLKPRMIDAAETAISSMFALRERKNPEVMALAREHGLDWKNGGEGLLSELREMLAHPEWADRYLDGLDDLQLDDFSDLEELDDGNGFDDDGEDDLDGLDSLQALAARLMDRFQKDGPDPGGWKEGRRGI